MSAWYFWRVLGLETVTACALLSRANVRSTRVIEVVLDVRAVLRVGERDGVPDGELGPRVWVECNKDPIAFGQSCARAHGRDGGRELLGAQIARAGAMRAEEGGGRHVVGGQPGLGGRGRKSLEGSSIRRMMMSLRLMRDRHDYLFW